VDQDSDVLLKCQRVNECRGLISKIVIIIIIMEFSPTADVFQFRVSDETNKTFLICKSFRKLNCGMKVIEWVSSRNRRALTERTGPWARSEIEVGVHAYV
jgi:predicted secreted protein